MNWALKLKYAKLIIEYEKFIERLEESQYEDKFHLLFIHEKMKYQKFEEIDPKISNPANLRNYKQEFEELSKIGSSNMTKVYKCTFKHNSEVFAIKKIPIDKVSAKIMLKDLEIIKRLNSESLTSIKSYWVEANYLLDSQSELKDKTFSRKSGRFSRRSVSANPYSPSLIHIQMELCYSSLEQMTKVINDELNQKIVNNITTVGFYVASELFNEILEGLIYLHKQIPPIIHRNLKPSNILINPDRNGSFIKLSDVGLNKFFLSDETISQNHLSGALKYVALETISSKEFDEKSDVFSLGVIAIDLFNFDMRKYEIYSHNV
jgi:serine/threonine protein kinase